MKQILIRIANELSAENKPGLADQVKSVVDSIPEELDQETYYTQVEEELKKLPFSPEKDPEENIIQYEETMPKRFRNDEFGRNLGTIIQEAPEILEQVGAKIISKFYDGGMLDHGAFGAVFKVTYKGKEAAAKITYKEEDTLIWEKILNLKNKLSPTAQNHIPKIYALEKVKHYHMNFYVIIMEVLEKANPEVFQKQIYKQDELEELYYLIANKINTSIFLSRILIEYGVNDTGHDISKKMMKNLSQRKRITVKDITQEFINVTGLSKYYTDNPTILENATSEFTNALDQYYQLAYVDNIFDLKPEKYSEETRGLSKLFLELEQNGIVPSDLHHGNVMYAPQRGVPVIIDVGGYDLYD